MPLVPGQMQAWPGNNAPFSNGLDLGRCAIGKSLGVYDVNPAVTFRAGSIVTRDASGLIIPCLGTPPMGVAKWNKALFLKAPVIEEPVTLIGVVVTPLKHANVENVKVTDITGVIPYTDPGDYSLVAINGTLVRSVPGTTIGDGDTVLVSYTFQLTEADLQFQGRNFWNFIDDSSQNMGKMTVIQDFSIIFTSQYDTAQTYVPQTPAYCAGGVTAALVGLFTNDIAEGDKVGRIIQAPTAADPFLGVEWSWS